MMCHKVKNPRATLLPGLIFPPESYLSATGLLDDAVCDIRARLTQAYQRVLIPLRGYAREFDKYIEFYKMDIDEYIV